MAYLRAMWSVFGSAVRHPLCTTVIDATTGRVLLRFYLDPVTMKNVFVTDNRDLAHKRS